MQNNYKFVDIKILYPILFDDLIKEYDIKEEGIDWNYLNAKRKEMLMMKNLIYPYIGSYKSIINAINYFGYNF